MAYSVTVFKEVFDKRLSEELIVYRKRYTPYISDTLVEKLSQHTFDLVEHGGKRLRPYIIYLTLQTEGMRDKEYWSVLLAMELFHTFALIHDDIIDRAAHRRSLSTLQHVSREYRSKTEVESIDEAYAILFGDLLFGLSKEILLQDVPQEKMQEVTRIFHKMIEVVVFGQIMDVSFTDKTTVAPTDIALKNHLKTSSYTFIYPMLLARSLGARPVHSEEQYEELGSALGEAFQVRDDILNCTQDVTVTGKDAFTDIEDGQHTCITQHVFDHGTTEQKSVLEKYFGSSLSPEDRQVVRKVVTESGAIEAAEKKVNEACASARALVGILAPDEDIKKAWNDCIKLIEKHV